MARKKSAPFAPKNFPKLSAKSFKPRKTKKARKNLANKGRSILNKVFF